MSSLLKACSERCRQPIGEDKSRGWLARVERCGEIVWVPLNGRQARSRYSNVRGTKCTTMLKAVGERATASLIEAYFKTQRQTNAESTVSSVTTCSQDKGAVANIFDRFIAQNARNTLKVDDLLRIQPPPSVALHGFNEIVNTKAREGEERDYIPAQSNTTGCE